MRDPPHTVAEFTFCAMPSRVSLQIAFEFQILKGLLQSFQSGAGSRSLSCCIAMVFKFQIYSDPLFSKNFMPNPWSTLEPAPD